MMCGARRTQGEEERRAERWEKVWNRAQSWETGNEGTKKPGTGNDAQFSQLFPNYIVQGLWRRGRRTRDKTDTAEGSGERRVRRRGA